ncbi:pentatricopeptide repeat-containing protein At2g03880, mitochondrial [Arachis duranensis]|uniref:Pentatricopeptide repeat-containing protein At2g03880, mitochondrial n=1 Tax=Arachis duranensis TaxID=130453 RepID=A0A6P4CUC1_ARADU|nr:pentatricopeptide repeat-containing protein At2g03880, mitochondrial [Arachis duranensis]
MKVVWRWVRSCASVASPTTAGDETVSLLNDFATMCHQRDLPRAMHALDAMERRGVRAHDLTYAELVKCCLARRAVSVGKRVHRHVFSNGYLPETFLVNTLLNMYVKFHLLEEAHKLFDEMPERNVVSWTTLISAYSQAKLNDTAMRLLIGMLREGVMPNMFTFSSVLRSCERLSDLKQLHSFILKVGLESDVFVRSALIDVYSKLGELFEAQTVFREMVTGDPVVWSSIIAAFAQHSNGDVALNLYKRMRRTGFLATQPTLTSVLRACTSLSLLELGMQAHVHVLKYDQDLILNNALLDMYCKCGSVEDAKLIFNRMAEKDVISWSTMIAGLAQNGFSLEALDLFDSMKVMGPKPNYITMLGVLFACSHAGLVNEGWNYFRSMKNLYGIDSETEHYSCMLDLLGRAGKLDDMVKLIQEMSCEPDVVAWRTLLYACRAHRNVDLATYAAKELLKLDPQDTGAYVLLSNIYANSEKWNDVVDVRRTMRARGIRKEPGCSWIEVNKQVHAFILGDKSHPQIDEINTKLDQFISRLKGAGYVPDTNFVLKDLEGEQREDSLRYHSEKLAIVFGIMSLPREKSIRIWKNLRICGDCHIFAKLIAKLERRHIVIRDPIRYHHFRDGICSCGDYW